ncbi:MAG: AAA family ATPase [Mycobacteriales bacterium]
MSKVVLLTGPSGAGKSQTSAAWAERGATARAVIDADRIRLNIRAGIAYPEDGWNDQTQRQWDAATEIWQAMVRIYRKHSIDCAVDVYAPPWPDSEVDVFLHQLQAIRVILLPTLQTCLERNRARGNLPLLSDELVTDNYREFVEGIRPEHRPFVIDNSDLTLNETVGQVEAIIGSARHRAHPVT